MGWTRITYRSGFAVAAAKSNEGLNYHRAYYGAPLSILNSLLATGTICPRGGKILSDKNKIQILSGKTEEKVNQLIKRKNEFTNKEEVFNPHQYFVSPSIKYISDNAFLEASSYPNLQEGKSKSLVKCCLEVAILNDIYSIGQQSIGSSKEKRFDEIIPNNQLEWYWEGPLIGGVHITSLLIKIDDVS